MSAPPRRGHAEENMLEALQSELADAASALLVPERGLLGAVTAPVLQPFAAGALGNFPYYWENPSTLQFNALTYRWINANLRAGAMPVQLDQTFTGYFIAALGSVSYQLSQSDQTRLSAARQAAVNEQAAVLTAWRTFAGSIPAATNTQAPIDSIVWTVAATWARPPTTLEAMQAASDLPALLNATPAGGAPVVSAVGAYLDVFEGAITLINDVTLNTGLVQEALQAVQSPSTSNGGLLTDLGNLQPAYTVNTPLSTILAGLSDDSRSIPVALSVRRTGADQYSIAIGGRGTLDATGAELLSVVAGDAGESLLTQLAIGAEPVAVDMIFSGVTVVSYGPAPFDQTTGANWFWISPIAEAIANGTSDVSGFSFSPQPQIDFSTSGPFGFLTGVAISRMPLVTITATGANYEPVRQFLAAGATGAVSVAMPAPDGAEDAAPVSYVCTVCLDDDAQSIALTLVPADVVASDPAQSRAWVLGAVTQYPAAR
jgi:hypothetical protein